MLHSWRSGTLIYYIPGTDFLDPIETVQQTVDYVLANENVNRVIVVTHIGYVQFIPISRFANPEF